MAGGDPQTPGVCAGVRIRLLAPALPGHGLRPPRAPSPVLGCSWGPVASALVAERADFRAPKGTQDVLTPESGRWAELIATFEIGRASRRERGCQYVSSHEVAGQGKKKKVHDSQSNIN